MSDSRDRNYYEGSGKELFTPEVIETLRKTYATAVGLMPGIYINLPYGSYIKKETGIEKPEEPVVVAGYVVGIDLTKAPERVIDLIFELVEFAKYPEDVLAEFKRVLRQARRKEPAVTFLSEV